MVCSLLDSSAHGNSSVKKTGVGCHALLQVIFPTQGSNPCFLCLPHWQVGSLPLVKSGKSIWVSKSTVILCLVLMKSWLIGKDPDAGRAWGWEEKGMTEDEVAGWHHWLDGHESEWTPGVGDGQGGLAYCDSWSHKESDTTEWLNWTCKWHFPVKWKEEEKLSSLWRT